VLLNVCPGVALAAGALRCACEAFGALSHLETAFQRPLGVVFVAFHDLRCAERAFRGLAPTMAKAAKAAMTSTGSSELALSLALAQPSSASSCSSSSSSSSLSSLARSSRSSSEGSEQDVAEAKEVSHRSSSHLSLCLRSFLLI
jgi:hypothetical protein